MWVRLWLAISLSSVYSQGTDNKITKPGAVLGWGWNLSASGDANHPLESLYYLVPPQAQNVYATAQDNTRQMEARSSAQPINFYFLPQQQLFNQQGQELIPTAFQNTPTYYRGTYTTQSNEKFTDHLQKKIAITDNSKPLAKEDTNEYRSPVQVFKNHNCSEPKENISKDLQNDINKSKELFAEVPHYDLDEDKNYATHLPQPYTYRGAVSFKVETPRPNARNERYYYTTVPTPPQAENTTLLGIDKLVASTQDLISNEDLLYINHAAEKQVLEQSEEIKPRSRYIYNTNEVQEQGTRNHITVKAKISNIHNTNTHQLKNNEPKQDAKLELVSSDKYDFAEPIVVSDNSYRNFREQVVNNLVSSMVPYMADGYEIVNVKDTLEEEKRKSINNQEDEVINTTPRPINENYLAPITVGVRLINTNNSDIFDVIDQDPCETSFETVAIAPKEKTVVEIQNSIPLQIYHINDVEHHEYTDLSGLNEGRSLNNDTSVLQALYKKYIKAVQSKFKPEKYDNINLMPTDYEENENNKPEIATDQLEPSENIQSQVKLNLNDDSNTQRSEQIQYYDDYSNENQKIIQPIIIEKEVPVTKFVDRYIEKKVPYPEHVEVKVPVDRPVPVPVPVEKIVEKPVEVTRYVDKPYPVEVPRPYPVEVKVPYPVEQKVYVDRPVHVPYPIEKVVEKQVLHPVPVPTPVGIPIEVPFPVEHKVLYPVPVDRPIPVTVEVEKPVEKIVQKEVPVPYAVEKKVPYPVHYETKVPVPYPVEKRIPVPVERIVEKPVTVTKYVEKPIHIQVPVPQPVAVPVHVPQPYPVDRIVEKKVPYPVHIDRIVERPVRVPYPVEKIVEKIVEKPVVVTKYIDKPYPVEKKVPYPVETIVEKKVPYPDHVPIEVKVPYPVEKIVERPDLRQIPYAYSHSSISSESRDNPQYQSYQNKERRGENEKQKQANQQQLNYSQYYQLLREKEKLKSAESKPVQSTQWGNHYASSFQYINNQSGSKTREENKNNNLSNYLTYLTDGQSKSNSYFGPAPPKNQDDWWQNNKNYVVEIKMRSDREPKLNNLRIEYGGFKPPLIPSTEVDLDGRPLNAET